MHVDTPLRKAIESILEIRVKDGYTEATVLGERRVFNRLLRLADEMGTDRYTEELASRFPADTENARRGGYRHARFLAHSRALRMIESHLEQGKPAASRSGRPKDARPIADGLMMAIDKYRDSDEVSHLSRGSLKRDLRTLRYIMEHMTSLGHRELSDIRAGDTANAIQEMVGNHFASTSLSDVLGGLRRFYGMFPETMPHMREIPSRLPRKRVIVDTYSGEERRRILDHLNSEDISPRDAAICLLCFETGLRGSDICGLKPADIDWRQGVMHVTQSKTGRPLDIPLRSTYGNAMYRYYVEERPQSDSGHFFLRAKAPHVKLEGIGGIVRKAVGKAGVEPNGRPTGPRLFRHNAATAMLEKGVPLDAISEELGHRSPNTTMRYLATDQETMRKLTLPLPGAEDRK